jgi:hypothetical protein
MMGITDIDPTYLWTMMALPLSLVLVIVFYLFVRLIVFVLRSLWKQVSGG